MAAENSVPWYLKRRSQVILLFVAFLGLAVGIASLISANGAWRIVAVISCSAIFLALAGSVIHLQMLDRRPEE